MPRWTLADVTYDAATHTSKLPNGTDVPHVTTILRSVGVSKDFDVLAQQMGRGGRGTIRHAGDRGTAVHADCHAYDDGDLAWETVDPRVRPYVEAWATFREHKRLRPVARERRLYHARFSYTGIMDGIFEGDLGYGNGDIKTGDPESSACHLQTQAYLEAWMEEHAADRKLKDFARWSVWLRPERRIPYTVFDYSGRPDAGRDAARWQACLTVYAEQPDRRRKVA